MELKTKKTIEMYIHKIVLYGYFDIHPPKLNLAYLTFDLKWKDHVHHLIGQSSTTGPWTGTVPWVIWYWVA